MKIQQKIIEIAADLGGFKVSKIKPESEFLLDLHFDDRDILSLVCEVEEAFDIDIIDFEIEKLQRVSDLVKLVEDKSKPDYVPRSPLLKSFERDSLVQWKKRVSFLTDIRHIADAALEIEACLDSHDYAGRDLSGADTMIEKLKDSFYNIFPK